MPNFDSTASTTKELFDSETVDSIATNSHSVNLAESFGMAILGLSVSEIGYCCGLFDEGASYLQSAINSDSEGSM